jgi:predicted dehydrogenase
MTRTPLGVAIAGFGWMGRVHTQAYARVLHHFPQLTVAAQLVAVADEVSGRAEEAAEQFGFTTPTRDWHEVAADPGVAAVSITAPNFLHREIGSRWRRPASTSGSRSRLGSRRTTRGRSRRR